MTETKELNSFTELLREENIDSWRAATTHRFVRELANDTISDDVFRRYLVQDFSFVETLVDLAAYAVAKATTMAAKRKLSTFLRTITNDETNYFQRALNAVGAPGAFHTPPPLNDVTDAFRTMMLDTASNGSYAEILSILVPAEWIYLTWATAARDAGKRRGPISPILSPGIARNSIANSPPAPPPDRGRRRCSPKRWILRSNSSTPSMRCRQILELRDAGILMSASHSPVRAEQRARVGSLANPSFGSGRSSHMGIWGQRAAGD